MNDSVESIHLPDGTALELSSGKYAELLVATLTEFAARYAANASPIYINSAAGAD